MGKDRQERYAYWASLIDEHEKVGGLQSKFCEARNISTTKMSYYRSELKKQKSKCSSAESTLTPINIVQKDFNNPSSLSTLKITLPNGFICELPSNYSMAQIKNLMGALLSC